MFAAGAARGVGFVILIAPVESEGAGRLRRRLANFGCVLHHPDDMPLSEIRATEPGETGKARHTGRGKAFTATGEDCGWAPRNMFIGYAQTSGRP
jgi:hypothetical protein